MSERLDFLAQPVIPAGPVAYPWHLEPLTVAAVRTAMAAIGVLAPRFALGLILAWSVLPQPDLPCLLAMKAD